MGDPARWGILGTGLIASMFANDLDLSLENEVHAIASRRPRGAKGLCDSLGIPKSYDSYEHLVADPDIDLVYVAVPHSAHFEVSDASHCGWKADSCREAFHD
jgi:predicted dehydrogenase